MSVLIGASVNPDTVVKCNKEKLAMDILLSYILLVAWISRPGGLTLMDFLTSGGKIFPVLWFNITCSVLLSFE